MPSVYDNLVGPVTQELTPDGKAHTTKNPGGQATTLSTAWQGENLVSSGTVTLLEP